MQRRRLLKHALTAPLLALSACSKPQPLHLGIDPWIGHEPLLLAQELNWLDPSVHITPLRQTGELRTALQGGGVDAAALTLDEMLSLRANGLPLVAVLVFDNSAGADLLVARPAIATLNQLRGRRLAFEPSAVGRLMLSQVLAQALLAPDDLQLITMVPAELLAAWRAGRIDAAITYDPTASLLLREGAVRLFDSRSMPETIFDVLAVRRDRLAARRPAIEAAVAAHFRGLAHLRTNRQDAAYRIATRNGMRLAEVMQALAGVALPDLAGNKALLAPSAGMRAALQGLNNLMVTHRLLPRPDPLDDVFDGSYLPADEPDRAPA